MTVAKALDEATVFLASSRPRTPRLDAEVLLAFVLGQSRTQLYTAAFTALATAQQDHYQKLLERRAAGVPVAYLVGWKEFYGRRFEVSPAVLIPRPETELVVEVALQALEQSRLARPRILDLCTGSGCLAVTLALEVAEAQVRASDICSLALEVAQANSATYHLERRLKFYQGDMFEAIPAARQPFDLIVSNPPYVATDAGPRPESGVVRHEPNLALFAGRDGLDLIRKLIQQAPEYLNPGGTLVIEMAPFQIEGMEALMQERGFAETRITPDLAGLPRVLSGRWEA